MSLNSYTAENQNGVSSHKYSFLIYITDLFSCAFSLIGSINTEIYLHLFSVTLTFRLKVK